MRLAAPAVLILALAACGKPSPAPAPPPTAAAVGAELATFSQLLMPISSTTWARMQEADERKDFSRTAANRYARPYAHAGALVDGKDTSVFLAYTGVFLAPAPLPLQPMTVQQFLRAFAADSETELAGVVAAQGTIFFTREQLPDVIAAARAAGAADVELPYSVVRGVKK